MHVTVLPYRGVALGLAASLLLAATALGADRPRPRPTPEPPPTPPAGPSPTAVASPGSPDPSVTPSPGPVSAGCLGVERPDPLTPPGASASDAPGSPPGTTPSPTPAPKAGGTQRIKLRTVGVRLDVPAAWLVLAGDELTAVEELPAVARAMAGVEDGSLVLLGADVLPDATCSVGTLVTVVDLGEAVPDRALAAAAGVLATGLESLPEVTEEVKVSSVDLPIGPAQRPTFQVDATADGAVVAWWVRLDVLAASGHTLALGSAAPEAAVEAARPLVNAVAKSLREL